MQSMPNSDSRLELELRPGEVLWAMPGTLANLEADLAVTSRFFGGPLSAGLRRLCSLEPVRMVEIRNATESNRHLMLTPHLPGDIGCLQLQNDEIYLNPDALLACSGKIRLRTRWAGAVSRLTRDRSSSLAAKGVGRVWFSAFGALLERDLTGELQVDPSHLLAYESRLRYEMGNLKTVIRRIARGDGTTPKLRGNGKVFLQTRSLASLTHWLDDKT